MDYSQRLAPFIKEHIYRSDWRELRAIQVASCDVIFNTDDNLLLASGTASGKTEAAFFPSLTKLYEEPSKSVGILYISPLKALINDQFERLQNGVLAKANIKLTKWHGDANRSKKQEVIKNPSGIIQITPESLESLIMSRDKDIKRLFSDLRFIIIDEVHYFMDNDRGIQLTSLIQRIEKSANITPRRIGLSATVGDLSVAKAWINAGSDRECTCPNIKDNRRKVFIGYEYFDLGNEGKVGVEYKNKNEQREAFYKKYYNYLYKNTLGKKSIIFTNSRSAAEVTTNTLKRFASQYNTRDVYRVHHGSIANAYRESTEDEMKNSDLPIVTSATLTLELGIDIGQLDRIVQLQSPPTSASFVQRLGRCGRRGNPAQMLFVFFAEELNQWDWDFLKSLAIVELYSKEKWIEPNYIGKYPFGLLYHQTMSYIYSETGIKPNKLASYMLSLSPFESISMEDYKILLSSMIKSEHLHMMDDGQLIIGLKGEPIVNHFSFYSVFEAPREFDVKFKDRLIGTVDKFYQSGERFVLAGHSWVTIDVNLKAGIIYVDKANTKGNVKYSNKVYSNTHSKIAGKMKEILLSDDKYPYLSENSFKKLTMHRDMARSSSWLYKTVSVKDKQLVINIWAGDKEVRTLAICLIVMGVICFRSGLEIITKDITEEELLTKLDKIKKGDINIEDIKKHSDEFDLSIMPGKFNELIPKELLHKQFVDEYIDLDEMRKFL